MLAFFLSFTETEFPLLSSILTQLTNPSPHFHYLLKIPFSHPSAAQSPPKDFVPLPFLPQRLHPLPSLLPPPSCPSLSPFVPILPPPYQSRTSSSSQTAPPPCSFVPSPPQSPFPSRIPTGTINQGVLLSGPGHVYHWGKYLPYIPFVLYSVPYILNLFNNIRVHLLRTRAYTVAGWTTRTRPQRMRRSVYL